MRLGCRAISMPLGSPRCPSNHLNRHIGSLLSPGTREAQYVMSSAATHLVESAKDIAAESLVKSRVE